MSTVVQSTCPGCKKPLRIPSDWLSQAIRCKNCGMVLQTKRLTQAAPRPSGARPATPGRTPAPPSHALPATAAVAAPVAAAPANPSAGGAFAFDAGDAVPVRASRYRRKKGNRWVTPVVLLGLFVAIGLAGFFCWPYVRNALQTPQQPQQASVLPDNGNKPTEVQYTPEGPRPKEASVAPKPKEPAGKNDPAKEPNGPITIEPKPKPSDAPKPTPDVPKGQLAFPRRALVISVHNYLYANPVHAGMPIAGARNIPNFLNALNKGLHVPMTEMAHLSDASVKGQSRAPMKPVIEKTLTDFLDSSRAQDRIMVFFVGHAVAIGDDAYLAPIEGELDKADTLIPLKWVYEQMAKCKARQKVLVVDVDRLNPGHGLERPNGGPMDPKVDAALKAPPEGVQVWTACVAGQQSYETDDSPMGVFLDKLNSALSPAKGERGMEGKIQRPEDPLPLESLQDLVNSSMKEDLAPYKLEQQSRLAGAEPKDGAAYDRAEAPAPTPVLASAGPPGDMKQVQALLAEVGVPPIKASSEDSTLRLEMLPPFPADKISFYPEGGDDTPLRKAVLSAREVVWALNTAPPPPALMDDVQKIRKGLSANLTVLKDGFRKPGNDAAFKDALFKDEKEVADMMDACDDALKQLKAAGEKDRDKETKRWQANYDFTLARLEAQEAYLFEYQSMLGQMRKQAPDLAPGQNGWKLASQEALKGDSQGKNLAKSSRKLLDQIVKENPGTPWEVLAKREKLTALGLQWQGAKVE